jgi:hypothetical protein
LQIHIAPLGKDVLADHAPVCGFASSKSQICVIRGMPYMISYVYACM